MKPTICLLILGQKRTNFHNILGLTQCKIPFYIEIWFYFYEFQPGNDSRGCAASDEDLFRQFLI